MPGKRGPIKENIIRRHVAEAYGVDRTTVTRWLNAGKLKGLTLQDILDFDRIRRQPGNKH